MTTNHKNGIMQFYVLMSIGAVSYAANRVKMCREMTDLLIRKLFLITCLVSGYLFPPGNNNCQNIWCRCAIDKLYLYFSKIIEITKTLFEVDAVTDGDTPPLFIFLNEPQVREAVRAVVTWTVQTSGTCTCPGVHFTDVSVNIGSCRETIYCISCL